MIGYGLVNSVLFSFLAPRSSRRAEHSDSMPSVIATRARADAFTDAVMQRIAIVVLIAGAVLALAVGLP